MSSELILTSAVVAAIVSLVGVALGKSVELYISRKNVKLEYDRRRAEFKMSIFGEYSSKMHNYRRIIDERWVLVDVSPEWKLRMSSALNEITTTPVQLLLSDNEIDSFHRYAEKARDVAQVFVEFVEFDSELYRESTDQAVKVLTSRMRENPKKYRRKKIAKKEAESLFIAIAQDHAVAEVKRREGALEIAENELLDLLRKNLQRDL